MVISCSSCQKKKTSCFQVEYLIHAVCRHFKYVIIYAFFPPNLPSQNFRVHKKWFFHSLILGFIKAVEILVPVYNIEIFLVSLLLKRHMIINITKQNNITCQLNIIKTNRPSVTGAVLQTALSFIHLFLESVILFLKIFRTS